MKLAIDSSKGSSSVTWPRFIATRAEWTRRGCISTRRSPSIARWATGAPRASSSATSENCWPGKDGSTKPANRSDAGEALLREVGDQLRLVHLLCDWGRAEVAARDVAAARTALAAAEKVAEAMKAGPDSEVRQRIIALHEIARLTRTCAGATIVRGVYCCPKLKNSRLPRILPNALRQQLQVLRIRRRN